MKKDTDKEEVETFYPMSRQEWRAWLQEHHDKKQSIWLMAYKKKTGIPTISWSESVDEALCFGWIDSTKKTVDAEKFIQFFTRRKPKSVWSKVNKEKIERLIDEGLMTKAGFECIERAKQNGSWTTLDEAEELNIPNDLETAFQTIPGSEDFFLSLSKSARKAILQWLILAKRPETRQNRVNEIVELAGQRRKPKQF